MPARAPIQFKLLAAFQNLFYGNIYKHRVSTLGNTVATHLYEDLHAHGGSSKFSARVTAGQCVVNIDGSTRGVKARRGDGTFGALVPGSEPIRADGFDVLQGMVALTHIGAEFKIVATAHLKQIDRVMQDLTGSATSLKEKSPHAITVGFAAVNYSERWTGMEGTRSFLATILLRRAPSRGFAREPWSWRCRIDRSWRRTGIPLRTELVPCRQRLPTPYRAKAR